MSAVFPMQALVRRELRTSLRQTRSFTVLLLITGLSTAVVLWQWNMINQQYNAWTWQGINLGGARLSDLSRQLLDTLTLTLIVGCTIFIPGLAASSLTSEKEQDTLDLLHMSLIPSWGIVLGKLANAVGLYLLIIIATLPIAGVLFFTAGVDTSQMTYRFVEILTLTLAVAATGLVCSALFTRTVVALVATYAAVIAIFGGPVLALWIFVSVFQDLVSTWAWDFNSGIQGSIFDSIMWIDGHLQLLSDYMMPYHPGANDWRPIFYRTAIAFNALLLTHVLLRRTPKPRLEKETVVIDDATLLDQRRRQFPYYLVDPMKRPKPVPDGANPMLIKELRWGFLGRMNVLLRMLYGGFIVLLFVAIGLQFALITRSEVYAATGAASGVMALVLLLTPALLANALTKEREQGNLDMLRMTVLRPGQVLFGKIAAGLVSFAPLLIAAVTILILLALINIFLWTSTEGTIVALQGIGSLLLAAVLSSILSLIASLHVRSSSTAIVLSYALTLFFFFGLALIAYPIISSIRFAPPTNPIDPWAVQRFREKNIEITTTFSPVLSYMNAIIPGVWGRGRTWLPSFYVFIPLILLLYLHARHTFNRHWRLGA